MAGRIPKAFIDDLLARADIVALIDRRVPLKRAGANYQARCPFHEEKTPSFTVSPTKQFYHCFGCGAHGTAIGFLMAYDRLSFPEAVEALAAELGLEVPREGGGKPGADHADLYEALAAAERFYRRSLREHPPACDYLKARGVSGATARDFGLGYAPAGWDRLLAALGRSETLLRAGLVARGRDGRCYDRFRERIMFPIRDGRGRCIGFGGRRLGEGDGPKYLNSPETPLFHKGRAVYGLDRLLARRRRLDRVLVVEGYMDVVLLAEHGIDFAVATLGTALTPEHLRLLFRHAERLVLCFDGDAAGQQAAWRALYTALPELDERRRVEFLTLPAGEDPDSLVRREGAEAFAKRLEGARPLSEALIAGLLERAPGRDVESRARLAALGRDLLARLRNPVLRELIAGELAARSALDAARLLEGKPPAPAPAPPAAPRRGPARVLTKALRALACLLHHPELAAEAGDPAPLRRLDDPDVALLCELLELLRAEGRLGTAQILERFRDHPAGPRLALLAAEPPLDAADAERAAAAFSGALARLHKQAAQARLRELLARGEGLSAAERAELDALTHSLRL